MRMPGVEIETETVILTHEGGIIAEAFPAFFCYNNTRGDVLVFSYNPERGTFIPHVSYSNGDPDYYMGRFFWCCRIPENREWHALKQPPADSYRIALSLGKELDR